ncbi:MAG: preprotein translocase subunit YajC [Pseudobacteriovorax sp.]|nr:preprotein translocase subunit YajC [Pseudobacteriovorax sp.]
MELLTFSSTAWAQAAEGAAKAPSIFEIFGMPALMLILLYFVFMRPQMKKQKDHANLLKELKNGDEVVTSGGIIGRVKSISDLFVTIDAGANTSLKIQKQHVLSLTEKQAAKTKA